MLPLLDTLQFQTVLAVSAIVALAIPVTFIGVRESTKHQRRRIVDDLSTIFERKEGAAAIPSFEFVKYKYNPSQRRTAGSDANHDFKISQWIVGIVPLCLFLFAMNVFSLIVVLHAAFKLNFHGITPWLEQGDRLPLFAWIVLAAYVGGLLFTLRAFKQAVNNFDMSPLSLVGAIVNLAFGPAVALLLVFTIFKLPDAFGHEMGTTTFPLVLVTAFAAGYYPELAIRQLMRLSRLRGYKRFDVAVYNEFKAIPVDVIDGIDAEIRARLSDYHIDSVQNLATANPLMLFVETPYGVYEIMDWVAQAQLCSSVGPQALLQLWELGIRTIFDLERVALDTACRDDTLTGQIGDILWSSNNYATALQAPLPPARPPHPPLSAVEANIRMRIANTHALRLRQIFNQVSYSLGDDARDLPPIGRPLNRRLPVRRRPLFTRRAGRVTVMASSLFDLVVHRSLTSPRGKPQLNAPARGAHGRS